MNKAAERFLKYGVNLYLKKETGYRVAVEGRAGAAIWDCAKDAIKLRHLLPNSQQLVLIFNDIKIEVTKRHSWEDVNRIYWLITNSKTKNEAREKVKEYKETHCLVSNSGNVY